MRASIEEYKAVEEAAMKFVKSVAEGNSQYAKELFIDEAVLFGYLDGQLEHGSIEQFYRNVDTVGAGNDFKARIDVVDVEETLARLNPTNFKNRIRVDNATVSGWEVNRIFIEIRTMDELKELYKLFGEQLILSFDEKYPHIVIYDGYIE